MNLVFPVDHLLTGHHSFTADPAINGYFLKQLGGIKDRNGVERLIVIEPGDDVKAKLEAAPNGSWVLIFPGEYYVSESIDLSQKTNLRITGFGFEKDTDYDPTIIYTDQDIYLFDLGNNTGATNIVIENMRLEQRGSQAGRGIHFANQTNSRYFFSNLFVYNFTEGIYWNGNTAGMLKNIYADSCYRGILITNSTQVSVDSVYIANSGAAGMIIYSAYNCLFTNIHCYNCYNGVSFTAFGNDVHPGSLLSGFTCKDCARAVAFYTNASGYTRTMTVTSGVISHDSTSAVAFYWGSSYGYAPVSIANVRLLGQFGYGFQDTVTNSSSDFVINLLMGVDALNASFANAAFDMPHLAEIKEVGHNPGLL